MNKNLIIGAVIGVVVIGGAGFWGGMVYAKSQTPSRGQFSAQFANGQFGGGRGARTGGGITAGQILSKDATSITIKMQDGSTKIVLLGSSTEVMKQASGTTDDLAVGTNVAVTGSANSDGSVTAQTVQIRPAGTPFGGGGQGGTQSGTQTAPGGQ